MSRELVYLLIASVASLIVFVLIAVLFGSPVTDDFFTEFMAVTLGIMLVFSLDRYYESEKNKRDCDNWLSLLRDELEETQSKLYPRNKTSVVMLYPEVWDSVSWFFGN